MPSLLDEACAQLRQVLQQRSGPARALLMERALELYHWALDEQQRLRDGELEDGAAKAEGLDGASAPDRPSPHP